MLCGSETCLVKENNFRVYCMEMTVIEVEIIGDTFTVPQMHQLNED